MNIEDVRNNELEELKMEECFLCKRLYKIEESDSILPDVLCSKKCEDFFQKENILHN